MATFITKANGVSFSVRDAKSGSNDEGSNESVSEHGGQIAVHMAEGWMV
jgi:hypothetical protein